MSQDRIRAVALGLAVRDDEVLVARHRDEVAGHEFYRPLGGGIEFGERSATAVRREFREELGADVTVVDRLAAFENVFEFRGTPGHEVVFLHEVAFESESFYARDAFEAVETTGETFPVRWKPISDFVGDPGTDADRLYPDAIPRLLWE